MEIAFYLMTEKGYETLNYFIGKFGPTSIKYIVGSEDKKIKKDYFNEIKVVSEENNIKFYNRTTFDNEIENKFEGYKFSISWRWIIKNDKNLIVFHDSLLPKYRGFAPLVNSLVNGEKEIGVTALFATDEYDKGKIIEQKSIQINYPISIENAISLINPLFYTILESIYTKLQNKVKLKSYIQNEQEATYSCWLNSSDYFINWHWETEKIQRFVDAVGFPYDGAKTKFDNKIITVLNTYREKNINIEDRERHIGKIIFFKNNRPTVICKDGLLSIGKMIALDGKEVHINFRTKFDS